VVEASNFSGLDSFTIGIQACRSRRFKIKVFHSKALWDIWIMLMKIVSRYGG
jgi:hypothetical protein